MTLMATKTRTPTDAAVDAMIENADLAPEVKALLRVHHEEVIAGERRLLQRTFDAGARSAEKSAEEVFGEIHEMVAAASTKTADLTVEKLLGRKRGAFKAAPDDAEPLLINVPEAARLMNLNERTFRSRLRRRQIPEGVIKRLSGRVHFIRAKFIAWLGVR